MLQTFLIIWKYIAELLQKTRNCKCLVFSVYVFKFIDWFYRAYVGAKVQKTSEMFLWDNGSQEGFDGSTVGKTPMDGENCVAIRNAKAGGRDRAQGCDVKKQFICERDD